MNQPVSTASTIGTATVSGMLASVLAWILNSYGVKVPDDIAVDIATLLLVSAHLVAPFVTAKMSPPTPVSTISHPV